MELANGFTKEQIGSCISPRRLELTILPTEKCNFRCVYCYEKFEQGAMKHHIVEGVKNLITRRVEGGVRDLSISWFGGEPLLALKVIRAIMTHANKVCKDNECAFTGSMTTNAYNLTPNVLHELVAARQYFYQITS